MKMQYTICQGIVEDVDDPLKAGRAKVRIFGYHSEKKEAAGERGIPTEDLPWAMPGASIDYGLMSGIGKSPLGIVKGTEVLMVARDVLMQDLIMICVIGGIHQEPAKSNEGFYDPDGEYPIEDRLLEPDINRLARTEKLDQTYLQDVADRYIKNIPIAFAGTWGEPVPKDYIKPEYPFNKVTETTSGHVFEVDDTEGFERISTWHKSGAFDVTTNIGERLIKTPSNFYITVEKDHMNIFIQEGSFHVTAKEDILFKAEGYIGFESKKGIKIQSEDGIDVDAKGNWNLDAANVRLNN